MALQKRDDYGKKSKSSILGDKRDITLFKKNVFRGVIDVWTLKMALDKA